MSPGLFGDPLFSGCDMVGSTEMAVGAYAEVCLDSEALQVMAAHVTLANVASHQGLFIVDDKLDKHE